MEELDLSVNQRKRNIVVVVILSLVNYVLFVRF